MKYKKSIAKLNSRIKDWESDGSIRDSNKNNPGSYTKPGSQNRHKN